MPNRIPQNIVNYAKAVSAHVWSSLEGASLNLWKKPVTWVMRLGTSDSTQSMAWAPQSYRAPPETSLRARHGSSGRPQ